MTFYKFKNSLKRCSYKDCKFHKKISVLVSLFNKDTGRKDSVHTCML